MFHVRTLTLDDMEEMKLGILFEECVDDRGDYATHFQAFLIHLIYFLLLVLLFYSIYDANVRNSCIVGDGCHDSFTEP